MMPWQRHIASLTIKKPKFVLLTCLWPFLATKGSRALEKKVNETQVSKTVFSHLKVHALKYLYFEHQIKQQKLYNGLFSL